MIFRKLIGILLLLVAFGSSAVAQADSTQPFYRRFPTITPFKILLSDSTTVFSREQLPKGKAVVFVVFSPDCSHCQHEAEELVAHKNELNGVQIVMITMHPFAAMKEFISTYKVDQVPGLVVGKDIHYMMPAFYQFHSLPFHAMYDRDGKLIGVFEGSMNWNAIAQTGQP